MAKEGSFSPKGGGRFLLLAESAFPPSMAVKDRLRGKKILLSNSRI
jgi:hypothetical protein